MPGSALLFTYVEEAALDARRPWRFPEAEAVGLRGAQPR